MLAKAIPVVIAIVLIIALVGIFYGETLIESVYYTSEREDLYQYFGLVESDDVAMIMQDAHIDEKAKLVDGNCYFAYYHLYLLYQKKATFCSFL